jgi:predicted phosphatase
MTNNENLRAERIVYRISEQHILLDNIYENLVDRDFVTVDIDIRTLISDLRLILKEIEEDDF